MTVHVGDVIKIRPSIFQDEFECMQRGLVWADKYLYEDLIDSVCLYLPTLNQAGDMAKTFFGSSLSRVVNIELDLDGNPLIVRTTKFEILFQKALANGDIELVSFNGKYYKDFKSEEELISNIDFIESEYLKGLFNVIERENNKLDFYKNGLYCMIMEGKWTMKLN
ncbi:hypothetical protein [Larkinella rosea]|uniref:Uncharacterized protein n=1 Tax=Larkinella rosea TaxID=2025312 RepID=A0A3P1C0G1_9BACT|nr:hypothetical protein [Larkinella rosea]RRB06274.1 hypothetical protein EHT25_00260 [Larkinella rosea]